MTLDEIQAEYRKLARQSEARKCATEAGIYGNFYGATPFLNKASAEYYLGQAHYCINSAHHINDPDVLRTCLGDAIIQIGHAMDLIQFSDEPDLSDDDFSIEFTDEVDDEELSGVELRSHHVE